MNARPQSALLTLLLLTLTSMPLAAGNPMFTVSPMEAHAADPREPGPGAISTLIRNEGGIGARVSTSGLDKAVYTTWIVIFNNPEFCATSPCTSADFPDNGGDPEVEASLLFGDGHYVQADGKAISTAGLAIDDTGDALWGPGLIDPFGAEVHFVLKTHGPLLMDLVHEQLSTSKGGCPPNDCLDQQFSVHLP